MKVTLETINRMKTDGIIQRYAIGGAVGATFYLEPVSTLDVDVFVSFQKASESVLITLAPLYEYLKTRGCDVRGEYIVIGGWPVQFLPAGDALSEEALVGAVETIVEGETVWVMTAEHLVAIALKLGRAKDHARIVQFVDSGVLDPKKLEIILSRHELLAKWRSFQERYFPNGGEER